MPDAWRGFLERFNQAGLEPARHRRPAGAAAVACVRATTGRRAIHHPGFQQPGRWPRLQAPRPGQSSPRTRVRKSTLVAAVRRAWRARSASIRPATGARAASTAVRYLGDATARPAAPRRAPARVAAEVSGEAGLARAASHRGARRGRFPEVEGAAAADAPRAMTSPVPGRRRSSSAPASTVRRERAVQLRRAGLRADRHRGAAPLLLRVGAASARWSLVMPFLSAVPTVRVMGRAARGRRRWRRAGGRRRRRSPPPPRGSTAR